MRITLGGRLGRALASLVTLAVAGALTVTTGAATQATAAAKVSLDIRVASYNVQNVSLDKAQGEQRPWRERRGGVIANIIGENVDVIGIQEVNPSSAYKSRLVAGKNQYVDLRNGLNAAGGAFSLTNKYAFNCQKARTQYRCKKKNRGSSHSDRILYNTRTLVLVDQGSLKYQAQRSTTSPQHMGWAVLRTLATGAEFLFTTTHLEPKVESVRKAQWQEMIAKINAIKGVRPVIATGDFNTHRSSSLGSQMLPAMKANGYGDVVGQVPYVNSLDHPRAQSRVNQWMNTANKLSRDVRVSKYYSEPWRPGHNIDWIFASNELPVPEWKVVANFDPNTWLMNGVIPSDHNMVRATLTLP
jgi:endonuclease/exonuclease/phosphatase family metal-dependent hydrolase